MQFYSWKTFSGVGDPIVEPKWISWDSGVTLCALGYPDTLTLCGTRPNFHAFVSLALPETTNGVWGTNQLLVATPTALVTVFATTGQDGKKPFVEVCMLVIGWLVN